MRARFVAAALAIVCSGIGINHALAKAGKVIDIDDVTGESIYFPEDIPDARVYRGTKSIDGEFPAMGWIGNCTATAVAPDVVMTAGHCKSTGSRITFQHRGSGRSYGALCTRHPRYNNSTVKNDWTFCKLDQPLPEGSVLASFNLERPATGDLLLVNGFGAPHVGTHYWGKAAVTRFSGQDLVACNQATLGGGDSGGSLLKWDEDRTGKGGFEIVGVNSRGNSSCSWYNMISDAEFKSFATEYETAKGVKLCGVSADCKKPIDPVDCSAVYQILGACMRIRQGVASECFDAYNSFRQCIDN